MRYWVLSGILLLSFLLQSVASAYFTIGGVAPDFMLVVVATYGLLFGWRVGVGAGIAGGLLLDLMMGRYIGLHVLSLGSVGIVAGLVEEKVFKDNFILPPIGGLVGSLVAQTILLICLSMFGWRFEWSQTIKQTVLPAALYDMCLMFLVYGRVYRYYLYLRPNPRGTIVLRK